MPQQVGVCMTHAGLQRRAEAGAKGDAAGALGQVKLDRCNQSTFTQVMWRKVSGEHNSRPTN